MKKMTLLSLIAATTTMIMAGTSSPVGQKVTECSATVEYTKTLVYEAGEAFMKSDLAALDDGIRVGTQIIASTETTDAKDMLTVVDMVDFGNLGATESSVPEKYASMQKIKASHVMADMKGPARETLVQKSLLSDLAIAA